MDVREEALFGPEHILLAIHLPLSRLELRAGWLVPRRNTRIVLCDGGDGLAQHAATILEGHGYGRIAVLDGGVAAWRAAGYATFSGVNVPSKVFGEVVEHDYHTPSISPHELKARIDAGDNMVVVDSRPLDEFHVMSIPTGTCVPGGELVYRIGALAPDPETLVVVNCAGRTRSIMGAQSLINAGIPNRVVALRNGTMGWHLAGLALDHGQSRYVPEVSPAQAADARRRAHAVCARFEVPRIDRATLAAWQADPDRTTFLLDVRSPEEFLARHLPGSVSAPGGQLVQATDRYVGTLRARLVLVDDDDVRAAMTASWLKQMALHEVAVLEGGLQAGAGESLETGPGPERALGLEALRYREIAPAALRDALADRPDAAPRSDPQRRLSCRPHRRRAARRAYPPRRADREPAGARPAGADLGRRHAGALCGRRGGGPERCRGGGAGRRQRGVARGRPAAGRGRGWSRGRSRRRPPSRL